MDDNMSKIKSLKKAIGLILKFIGLDLACNRNKIKYELIFYTLFNRLDVVNNRLPILLKDLIYIDADITVPKGYTPPRFDNTNREVALPINSINAVAFIIKDRSEKTFLRILQREYCDRNEYSCCGNCTDNYKGCSCFEDFAHKNKIYEVFVDAIDRSNNPFRGKVVAYDSEVIWLQAIDKDKCTPTTFYLIPIENISFIALYKKRS